MSEHACDACLRRAWLLSRLAGHLEAARGRSLELLELDDEALLAAVGGRAVRDLLGERRRFSPLRARQAAWAAGLQLFCAHSDAYPPRLRELGSRPAVLHLRGEARVLSALQDDQPVALVGARRAGSYALGVARGLGYSLSRAGVLVLSGMAAGIDSAAHEGALDGPGGTVAILAAGAERAYPRSKRALHDRISARGAAISELPPGSGVWRWTFPARNRIVAALAAMTVVVDAGPRSGALITAALARELGRAVGAVPGRLTDPGAAGPHALIRDGAVLIRDAQDVLDGLFGVGARRAPSRPLPGDSQLRTVLGHIGRGCDSLPELERAGFDPERALVAVAELELGGWINRGPGGRFVLSA